MSPNELVEDQRENDLYVLTAQEKRNILLTLFNKLTVKSEHESDKRIILTEVWKYLEKSLLIDNLSQSLVESYQENNRNKEEITYYKQILEKLKSFVDAVVEN